MFRRLALATAMILSFSTAHADPNAEPCDLVQTLQQFTAPIGQLMSGFSHAIEQLFPRRPYHIKGVIAVGDKHFEFVSGGAGWSIPYGDHRITPEDVGSWGARHGAMGLNHDDPIYDPQLHRNREGIELHPAHGDRTEGCVGIRDGWSAFKKAVLAMIDNAGSAFLHIGPEGAAITPAKASPLPVTTQVADNSDDTPPQHEQRAEGRHKHHHVEEAHRHLHHHRYALKHHRHYASKEKHHA